MPKILHCPTRIDMAAEDYHALRMDQNFDAFCAVRTKSKFSLQARSSEELKGHTIEHMECLLAYEENPIPAALRNALGAPPSSPAPTHRTIATHTASAFRHGRHQRLCLQVQVQMARFYGQSAACWRRCHGSPGRGLLPHRLGQLCRYGWAAAGCSLEKPRRRIVTPRPPRPNPPPHLPSLILTRDRFKFDEANPCTFSSEPPVFN